MRRNGARWAATGAEVLLLAAVLAFLASMVVRSHWGAIWLDAFTGWVAPLANRMARGTVLYGPGGHMPLPPLPFLLTYAVSGGHATWLTESALIVVCQSVLVLTMYVGLARYLPRPIPLVAALLTAPVYFAFPKTILYDSMTHALVALTAVATAWWVHRRETGAAGRVGTLALVGMLTAATMFSKQSIGLGLVLGILLLLVVGPPGRPLSWRVAQAVGFGLAALFGFAALAVAAYKHIDLKGMVVDVFLTGSEPKGGRAFMTWGLRDVVRQIGAQTIQTLVYGVGFTALLAQRSAGGAPNVEAPEAPATPAPFHPTAVLAAYAVACGTPLLLGVFDVPWPARLVWAAPLLKALRDSILWAGLIFLLLTFLLRAFRSRPSGACSPEAWLATLFPVCVLAAAFQSLSVAQFTGLADNNPLITLALAGFLFGLYRVLFAPGVRSAWRAQAAFVLLLFPISGALWEVFAGRVVAVRSCTQAWPEVRYLRGALLRPHAEGTRRLVELVGRLAPDPAHDEVLLLPNDPDVEACFERPRPALAGAIVFADQYWDRYVDPDFQRLEQTPPKVIIIGPRDTWRKVHRYWGDQVRGCERLIDLVQKRLLPNRYLLQVAHPITVVKYNDGKGNYDGSGRDEFMDVYVRNDGPPFVRGVLPADGSRVKPQLCRTITIEFGSPIDPQSVTPTSIGLFSRPSDGVWHGQNPEVPVTRALSEAGDRATLTVESPLSPNVYLIRVAESVRDREGRRRPADFYAVFEVVEGP